MAKHYKRTPEEREAIKKMIAEKEEKLKTTNASKKIKNGRVIIFVLAGFMVLSAAIEYTMLETPLVFAIYAPFFITFILFGIYYYRNPYLFSLVALILYVGLILLGASADPTNLAKGIIVKIIIIGGLVSAIKYGRDYKMEKQKIYGDELLDVDLID